MKLFRLGAVALLSLTMFACGDDEEEPPPEQAQGTVNEALVTQSANNAFKSTGKLATGGSGETAAFELMAVGQSAMGFATPAAAGGGQAAQSIGSIQQALGGAGCECAANSCTFTDCGGDSGYTINGSIEWTETSLKCDYTVGGAASGTTLAYNIFCDLTYGTTSLDGTLSTKGSITVDANGQSIATEFDTSMTFNDVTYSAGGPTGGSLDVKTSVTANGQSYGASASIDFSN